MATLKQRLHRKNASGTYDTVHFESSSDLILRPSGRTVEQDLADYLPEVQANDNVPESLNKFVCGSTKAFAKRRALAFEGTVNTQINSLRDDLERQIAEVAAGGDVDLSDYYTKSETDNLLDDKSDIGHTHSQYVTSSTSSLYYYYTKTQVDQIESELRAAIDEAAAGGDVDLSNYYTKYQTDNLLNQKAALKHSHAIGDITNLQSTLNGKASTNHSHSISDISNLQSQLNNKANSIHTHSTGDISGLESFVKNIISQGGGSGLTIHGFFGEASNFGDFRNPIICDTSGHKPLFMVIICCGGAGSLDNIGTVFYMQGSSKDYNTVQVLFGDDYPKDPVATITYDVSTYGVNLSVQEHFEGGNVTAVTVFGVY